MKPLSGITVLDVTQVLSGPFASMMLADLGAEVIKIENPSGGDIGRSNPPFINDQSMYFSIVNRNKKSISLDLQSKPEQKAFLDLATESDIIVENYTPSRKEKFGIDYETVKKHNNEIIYCSISGFGQTGPYSNYPALDIVVQAMSGNMSITGPSDSVPHRSGIPIGDIAASMYAVQSILTALYQRELTGEGQWIDVSMLDGLLSWLTVRAGYTFGTDKPYPRMGNELEEFVPYGIYETRDSHIAIVAAQDKHWELLCHALDRDDWLTVDEFKTIEDRRENRNKLRDALEQELRRQTTSKWFEIFTDHGIPSSPVYNTKEVWKDKHVVERDLVETLETEEGDINVLKHPVRFSSFEPEVEHGIPDLGEDTESIFQRIGYSQDEIAKLQSDRLG